jgi:hypothetical protein
MTTPARKTRGKGKTRIRKPSPFRFSVGFVMDFVGGAYPYVWVGAGTNGEEKHLTTFEPKEARKIGEALIRFADWAEKESQ